MKKLFFLFVLALLALSSCKEKSRFYVDDISTKGVNINIQRFDKDFFALDSTQLVEKYGKFYDLYIRRIISLPNYSFINKFKNDSMVNVICNDVNLKYANIDTIQNDLTEAFNYYHYYFPNLVVPKVMMHISGFNQTVVTTDSLVSASVDLFLGSDYDAYKYIAYEYEVPFMTKKHIPLDIMQAWLSVNFYTNADILLEHMIFQGKLLYLQTVFFSDYQVSEIISYTKDQYNESLSNEAKIWASIVEKKDLFSNDVRIVASYMNPAPFTSRVSQNSPPRLGHFIGYRIVESYMNNNKQVSLEQLMNNNNAQQILSNSGYAP